MIRIAICDDDKQMTGELEKITCILKVKNVLLTYMRKMERFLNIVIRLTILKKLHGIKAEWY